MAAGMMSRQRSRGKEKLRKADVLGLIVEADGWVLVDD
jgi:hypothetical protein